MAGDVDVRKSMAAALFFLGDSPISRKSQKQKAVALSSCEAEYIATTTAVCRGNWQAHLPADITGKGITTPTLRVDNKSAISLCKNPVLHDDSKHIDFRYHYIRQCVGAEDRCRVHRD